MTTSQERPDRLDAPGPLTSALHRWRLTVSLALVGLLLGLGAAWLAPVGYRAEARLAVAPDSDNAYAIAGFPLASRDLAANYARWVQNNATSGEWATPGVTSLEATPVPETAVIRIETQSPDQAAAVAGAQKVADHLVAVAKETQGQRDPQKAYASFQELAPKVAAAQAAVSEAESAYGRVRGSGSDATVAKATRELNDARTKLAELQLIQEGNGELYKRLYADTMGISQLKVISPAAATGDGVTSRLQRWGLLGLGAGLALGVALASLRDRRARRRDETPGSGRVSSSPESRETPSGSPDSESSADLWDQPPADGHGRVGGQRRAGLRRR
ncbi:hypothetical protein [Mobilicoccus sp.]|uniref:hypothetical protein n=1 Tax=Mobilicoccus sp. TaxID=2034349 RepID=UPI0028AEB4B4|nr:hypothetical protein [Mobilicoccus sp.]